MRILVTRATGFIKRVSLASPWAGGLSVFGYKQIKSVRTRWNISGALGRRVHSSDLADPTDPCASAEIIDGDCIVPARFEV